MIQESLGDIVGATAGSRERLALWFAHFREILDGYSLTVPENVKEARDTLNVLIKDAAGTREDILQLMRDWSNALTVGIKSNTPLVAKAYHNIYRQLFSSNPSFFPLAVDDEQKFLQEFKVYKDYIDNRYSPAMRARNIEPYSVSGNLADVLEGPPYAIYGPKVTTEGQTSGFHKKVHHKRTYPVTYGDLADHFYQDYEKENTAGFQKRQTKKKWRKRELDTMKKYMDRHAWDNKPELRQMVIALRYSDKDPLTGYMMFRNGRETLLRNINPNVPQRDVSELMKHVDLGGFGKILEKVKDWTIPELFGNVF